MLEWLKTILGTAYTEDIDKAVSTEIGKAFVSRTDFNAANEAKKALEGTVTERDKQLDELKKLDAPALKANIEKLQTENAAAKAKYEADVLSVKRDAAIDMHLIKAGAINTKAVRALLDDTKIKLNGDTLDGLDEQIKAIGEKEKWAFTTKPTTPPGKSGGAQGAPPPAATGADLASEIKGALFGGQNT